MAIALDLEPDAPPEPKAKKPGTSHLKVVPETRELRDRIREAAVEFTRPLDRSQPLDKAKATELTRGFLAHLGLGEQYTGFALVSLMNEFWRDQVAAIPFNRRLLLLPHCLKNAEGCPADYDEFGLDCKKCGACSVADFKVRAEELGYKVLVSEGTPIVLKIIVSGHVDAIVGVACLNVLEKAFDKILLAGIPCVATPLLSSNCKNTSVDDDWVAKMIELKTEPPPATTKTYLHLMRAANALFEEPELSRLAPRARLAPPSPLAGEGAGVRGKGPDPLSQNESIAYDWLAQGGKRSRPLITLAAFDALQGAPGTRSADGLKLTDAAKRTALAVEAFHKASLIHDDIADDDSFRYGVETLHRQYGVGAALNVGDYLLGLGYRLVSRERNELGAECACEILDRLADAHVKLSEGQGAELLWRDAADKSLSPLDALKIYALKTAPAFEAALSIGLRLAGPTQAYDKMVADFSRHLGIAFQILNDLNDWHADGSNKLIAGQDILAARPTLLLALALEAATAAERADLLATLEQSAENRPADPGETVERVRRLFEKYRVFDKAEKLIEKYRARAEALADEVQPTELRELLYYLVDTILDRPAAAEPEPRGVVQLVQLNASVRPTGPRPGPELEEFFALFAERTPPPAFAEVPAADVPPPYHGLLVHTEHMTVTVEAFHGGPVDVKVLASRLDDNSYARMILLTRQRDGVVVQFGIVRIRLDYCSAAVRAAILRQDTPLGRILIEHDVLRRIEPTAYLRIEPGPVPAQWFGNDGATKPTYGRLGFIYCDGQPAVELLEIVAPV